MEAYWITGEARHAMVRRKSPLEETARETEELLPELGRAGDFVRGFSGWPEWLSYEISPNEDRRVKFVVADAISSFEAVFGAEVLISESAARKLEPYLQGQAEFHPAKVANAPQPYYLLWVKHVVDALDYENSTLAAVEYLKKDGRVPLRIIQSIFKPQKLKDLLLFRLSPGQLTLSSLRDFATEDFLKLVKSLKITGFNFYRNHSERPRVPVKLI